MNNQTINANLHKLEFKVIELEKRLEELSIKFEKLIIAKGKVI